MLVNRLEKIRQRVDCILWALEDKEAARCGFVHLYGVAQTAVLLAGRRGLEPSMCGVAGMLHDLSSYMTGTSENHARLSALRAKAIMQETSAFTLDEINAVCCAIEEHSDKENTGTSPLCETLKDADLLQHHLYRANTNSFASSNGRLLRVFDELNCVNRSEIEQPGAIHEKV